MRRNKYGNRKIRTKDGVIDSRLEYHRWLYLQGLEREGRISDLRRQVSYEVIPKQTEIVEVQMKTKVKHVERPVERPTLYVADFVYLKDGRQVIEDAKSEITRKNPAYVMKRKLMRLQGNPVREITRATEEP